MCVIMSEDLALQSQPQKVAWKHFYKSSPRNAIAKIWLLTLSRIRCRKQVRCLAVLVFTFLRVWFQVPACLLFFFLISSLFSRIPMGLVVSRG